MKIKKFFISTKYFWFGGILGLVQQLLGELDHLLYHGREIFGFADIMSGLGFWAALIMLLMMRDVSPKQQLRDIFLLFVGLDFFYYLFSFSQQIYNYLAVRSRHPELCLPFSETILDSSEDLWDFIMWTSIGTAAAIWGFLAVKFREKGWKKRYIAMFIPLFAVIIMEFGSSSYSMVNYIIEEYKAAHNMPLAEGMSYSCTISSILTEITGAVICFNKLILISNRTVDRSDGYNSINSLEI